MSTAPADLLELGRFLEAEGYRLLGIVGDTGHTRGYHLGSDRATLSGDWSVATARDRRGLDLNASAIDIGRGEHSAADLRATALRLLASCIAGADGSRDLRELGAESATGGIIWRWDRERGSTSGDVDSSTAVHHIHAGYYRDSRDRDKRPLWARAITTEEPMFMLYGTGGQSRTFPVGTPYFELPNGRQIGVINDDRIVYRLAGEVRIEGGGRWWLIDGETSGSPLRYVKAPS